MTFAWLILAHDAPAQLQALLTRLLARNDDLAVVHIDRDSSMRAAADSFVSERVQLIETPVAVRWGHRSQLDATRLLIDAALQQRFDVAHLLSGRDWPVVPRSQIAADIAAAPGICWIDASGTEQQERMQQWWFESRLLNPRMEGGPLYRATKKSLRAASRIATRLNARANPYGGRWRKGSQWWSLPRDACELVSGELARLSKRFDHTACSDEHVIQTIAAHRFVSRIADPRRYVDWSEGRSSPKTLLADDLPAIVASGAWIARKVDASVDPWFLDPGQLPAI